MSFITIIYNFSILGPLSSDRPLLKDSHFQQPENNLPSPHFTQEDRPSVHFVTNSISNPYKP